MRAIDDLVGEFNDILFDITTSRETLRAIKVKLEKLYSKAAEEVVKYAA